MLLNKIPTHVDLFIKVILSRGWMVKTSELLYLAQDMNKILKSGDPFVKISYWTASEMTGNKSGNCIMF